MNGSFKFVSKTIYCQYSSTKNMKKCQSWKQYIQLSIMFIMKESLYIFFFFPATLNVYSTSGTKSIIRSVNRGMTYLYIGFQLNSQSALTYSIGWKFYCEIFSHESIHLTSLQKTCVDPFMIVDENINTCLMKLNKKTKTKQTKTIAIEIQ